MAVVSAPGYQPWIVARWAMRALTERAQEFATTEDDREALAAALALDGLHFDLLPSEQAARVARAVQLAADRLGPELRAGLEDRDQEFAARLDDLSLWLTDLAGTAENGR